MQKRKQRAILLVMISFLGFGVLPLIPSVSATDWLDWTSSAVGDVVENDLPDYWTITSTPKTGYEYYLWPNWQTVIDSRKSYYNNIDYELVFDTYSQSSYMGYILLESKKTIRHATEITFLGRFGAKYSYSQVKTIGRLELFDLTTQTVVASQDIKSGTTANTWKWDFFSLKISVNRYHQYVIRLRGTDAWSGQKVAVAWESAEVWFHSPYERSLDHVDHYWRYDLPYIYYLCEFRSDFRFNSGPLDDMERDHRPYVKGGQLSWGWDPCYLHEFRSEPYWHLEGDDWYSTNMPGSLGYTDSELYEEIYDGFEEVEVYTRNPESLIAGVNYWVKVRYQVWDIGYVTMTLESELGNEDDFGASASPPAVPVAWIDLITDDFYHSYRSIVLRTMPLAEDAKQELNTSIPVDIMQRNQLYDIIITGVYPYYLQIYTRYNIETNTDLNDAISEKMSLAKNNGLMAGIQVPATITFNGLVDISDVVRMVEKYQISVQRFRFTSEEGNEIIRGQGTPLNGVMFPFDALNQFIDESTFLGIHSIDIEVNSDFLESLAEEEIVCILDFAGYLFIQNEGINLSEFGSVSWYTEDCSWYLNYEFA